MFQLKKHYLLLLIAPLLLAFSTNGLEGIFGLKLKNLENEPFALAQLKRNKASVIVFLLPDCPACESYSKTLSDLQKKFTDANINFYGVFPGNYNTVSEMQEYQKTYKINFPLLQDPKNLLVKAFHAGIVPSAFVVDNIGNILYKGRIDDWMYALGKKRAVITKHDLRDALVAIQENKVILVKETKAIGCIIE